MRKQRTGGRWNKALSRGFRRLSTVRLLLTRCWARSVGSIRDSYVAGIDLINEHGAPVVALDIPTGINADTGALVTEAPVKADLTTTFIGAKLGLFTGPGVDFAGRIELSELDAPQAAFEQVQGLSVIPRKDSERAVSKRPTGAHKNNFGHVLIVGGDHGMCGAVLLAAEARYARVQVLSA